MIGVRIRSPRRRAPASAWRTFQRNGHPRFFHAGPFAIEDGGELLRWRRAVLAQEGFMIDEHRAESGGFYSPMIFTSTRLRLRPSNSP